MIFYDWISLMLLDELRKKQDLRSMVDSIRSASSRGKIAFYPCGKCTRLILKEIKKTDPALVESIVGCFDKSPQATSEPGISVYPLDRFDDFSNDIALLVVSATTYHSRSMRDIETDTHYSGSVLKTSYFDLTMPNVSPEELVAEIKEVAGLFDDAKSKMTYLLSWLSRILNDEEITALFESENHIPRSDQGMVRLKNYTIEGIHDPELVKELFSDVYMMKHVAPSQGGVLMDIGAFKGETAIVFADLVGQSGKVYAFEPTKAAYQAMLRNIHSNGLESIIEPVNMGCSSSSKKALVVSTELGAPWTFISDEDGSIAVDLISLDDFVRSRAIPKVDFIKMDVEGYEEDVLLGAREVITNSHPKMAIAMYHQTLDMISLPRLVKDLGDYRLYVRCNMDGPFALTLFCA